MENIIDLNAVNINGGRGQELAWSSGLETGYTVIDHQHKRIFRLASDLIESCRLKTNKGLIEETLCFLTDYTVYHFTKEEKLAKRYKYPHYEEHKRMHEDFTETVIYFIKDYEENGDSDALLSTVTEAILKWLIQHIQYEDTKIAQHIKHIKRR